MDAFFLIEIDEHGSISLQHELIDDNEPRHEYFIYILILNESEVNRINFLVILMGY